MLYDRRSMSAAVAVASCCCRCIDLSIRHGEEIFFNRGLLKRSSLRGGDGGVTTPAAAAAAAAAAQRLANAASSGSAESEDRIEQQQQQSRRAQRIGSSNQQFPPKVSGSGFGASSLAQKSSKSKKKKQAAPRVEDDTENKGTFSREKNPGVTRRAPPKQPLIEAQLDRKSQQIETYAVLALTALFFLIIVEGLTLAASGFLPEEWDELLLKAIYPSFTPTVAVFFAGAISYGLYKYLGSSK